MFKFIFTVFIFELAYLPIFAQKITIVDSLVNQLKLHKQDSNKVKTYVDLAIALQNKDSAKAMVHLFEALKLAKQINYVYGQLLVLNNLGVFYMEFNKYDLSAKYFKETELLALKNKNEAYLGKLYGNMGNLYSDWGKSNEALKYYNKSIDAGNGSNNLKTVGIAYGNIGNMYIQLGNYPLAAEYLLKGIAVREKIGDNRGVAITSSSLAVLYKELGKYDEATIYGNMSLKYFEANNYPLEAGRVLVNLGLIAYREKNYTKAEAYYDKALALFKANNFVKGISAVYNNRGLALKKQNKIAAALENYKQSLALAKTISDSEGQINANINLGAMYVLNNEFDLAETSLKSALATAQEIKFLMQQKSAKEGLSDMYKAKKDFENALKYEVEANELKDSIYSKDKINSIDEMKTKYETEKKELKISVLSKTDSIKTLQISNQQIAIFDNLLKLSNQKLAISNKDLLLKENNLLLKENDLSIKDNLLTIKQNEEEILKNKIEAQIKEQNITQLKTQKQIKDLEVAQKNKTIIGLSILMGMLTLFGLLYYKNYRIRQHAKLQKVVMQQQDIATKSILEAEENERKRIAAELHDGVGQLMSAARMNLSAFEDELVFKNDQQKIAFNNVLNMIDDGCKEVRSVSHQMMPNALLKLGLGSAIRAFIDQIDAKILKINLFSEGLNDKIDNNTELVLYRVIQECVNNVIKHSGANQLDISLIKDTDGISVTIEDNGVGFNTADKSKFEGIGLKNIQSRIAFLKGTVEFDSTLNKGTLVALHVPSVVG